MVGIDASIIMHPNVWRASGHWRASPTQWSIVKIAKNAVAPTSGRKVPEGTEVEYKVIVDHQSGKKETRKGLVGKLGIVCPNCGSPNHSDIRKLQHDVPHLAGSVDNIDAICRAVEGKGLSGDTLKGAIAEAIGETAVYLRPETAQAMFTNFLNVQASFAHEAAIRNRAAGKELP